MPEIVLETFIRAPAEICFDRIRDPKVHPDSKLTIVGDPDIVVGQRAIFESKVGAMAQQLIVEVVECQRPCIFVDEMVQGPFSSFRHIHKFEEDRGTTRLVDTLIWRSPWGLVGKLADCLIERRLRSMVLKRNRLLKELAEN
jgi:ligand-binding SRPBCC domain-containing protein